MLAVVAVVLLALAAYVAWQLATRESTAPVTIRQALARFRAAGSAAAKLPPALRGHAPTPGVYVYATRGGERTKAPLGTRRHTYAARTTITVTASGCGLRMRWDALATRYDALQACPGPAGGWRLGSTSERHEFFGHDDRRTYRCAAASTYLPALLAPGAQWTTRCAIAGTTTEDADLVLGHRTLTVAGRRVATLLVRTRTRVSGDTVGTGVTLTWLAPRSGLVVRRLVANASTTDTFVGDVEYMEHYTLALTSLRPLR
jgi:hypothetical protein